MPRSESRYCAWCDNRNLQKVIPELEDNKDTRYSCWLCNMHASQLVELLYETLSGDPALTGKMVRGLAELRSLAAANIKR